MAVDTFDVLKKCGFPKERWRDLGLRLNLEKTTLDDIDDKYPDHCLMEVLYKWWSSPRDFPSFGSLSDVLRAMNEIAVADKLDQESELLYHCSILYS